MGFQSSPISGQLEGGMDRTYSKSGPIWGQSEADVGSKIQIEHYLPYQLLYGSLPIADLRPAAA